MFDILRLDLRFALRSLLRRPLFTTVAVGTLAVGIGAATALFSVVDGVLIKKLPYRNPESLVSLWRAWPGWRGQGLLDAQWDHIYFPVSDYLRIRERTTTLGSVEAFQARRLVLTTAAHTEEISVGRATAGLFDLLGVRPIIGRTFLPGETLPSARRGARTLILSHEFWIGRFGGDAAVLGRSLVIGGEPYEVIGVLPQGFRLASDELETDENAGAADAGLRDAWVPLGGDEAGCGNCLELLARLARRATTDQARAELQTLLLRHPGDPEDQIARVEPVKARITQGYGRPLLGLFAAAGLLLLIACLNIAGLLAGEATRRHREIVVRAALGAGVSRVVRLLLTESVVLGLLGAAAGSIVAWTGTEVLLSAAPPLPRADALGMSGRALVFAAAAGVGTGLLFGLAPAAALIAPVHVPGARGSSRGRRASGLHAGVVSAQVALTVILLLAAGLFGRSFMRLMSVDPGFKPDGIVSVALTVPPPRAATSQSIAQFQAEVVRAVGEVPGVTGVSTSTELPFPGGKDARAFSLEPDGPMSAVAMRHRSVTPNYHTMMGIPLLAGRLLSESDHPGAPNAIVVSRSFAERIWPGQSPIGKRIYRTGPVGSWTVVGVVGDVREQTLAEPGEPTIYRAMAQAPSRRVYVVARATAAPAATLTGMQRAIRSVDASTLVTEPGPMSRFISDAERDARFRALLVWTFAGCAAVLAFAGIFGVTARAVAARTREIGIRMALGEGSARLIWRMFGDGMKAPASGIGIGLLASLSMAGPIRHLLYETSSRDGATYLSVCVLAIATCAAAAFLPARRAGHVTPMNALTEEE